MSHAQLHVGKMLAYWLYDYSKEKNTERISIDDPKKKCAFDGNTKKN